MNFEGMKIPARLNMLLLIVAGLASLALLWVASHAASWWLRTGVALAFSYTANTLFALMHESVHGLLLPDVKWNRRMGRVASAFFPTSLTLQRGFHLTHHRNNRSPQERFDYIEPGDIAWAKRLHWYGILTGLYWVVTQLGLAIYLVAPVLLRIPVLRRASSRLARQSSSRAYLEVFDHVDGVTVRVELLASFAFQALVFVALDLNLTGWALCYAAFAVHWSGLQYADHAFSPLDPQDGAWNLRASAFSRAMFLNYHYHLAHHRHPNTPWLHLGRFVEAGAPQPSFLRVWLSMWRGPRRLPAPT
ncbi:MAG TPA: fatty acid desaturase [Steroidobacteraceae bacterium]|nr:fatty acid desaturase [Steroidobacteraceae bacterium]